MKRADAQRHLEDAAGDGLKRMFSVLVSNIQETDEKALAKFRSGVTSHVTALGLASKVISEKFEE